MRGSFSLFAASLLAVVPANGQNDRVQRGPAPDWVKPSELMAVPAVASGLIFARRFDTLVHLDKDGEAHHLGYRLKILHPNALQLGNLSIAWNPSAGAPTVHAIRVHRGAAVIDVLETASFEILRRENQLEAASLDGVLTAILRIPDLRVGDELEVGLTTRSSDPTLGTTGAGLLVLAPSPPPGRFRLGLSWEEGQQPNLKMTADMTAVAKRSAAGVRFDFDNPAALAPPKDAPPRYKWQRIVEYSDFADWPTISRYFAPLFAQAARLPAGSPLRQEVRRIAAAHADPLDRARAALKLVQQEVRYIYVGLGTGNLTPATAEATWQRRYGDCKGKTALLMALLTEFGIEAEPVLVNNNGADDGLDARLPNPGMFDHILVRARIAGADYWMDGTLPPVAAPSLAPAMPYRWTLPLRTAGSAIERHQWRAPQAPDEVTLYEIDARQGFDKPARITRTTVLRGIAGLQQHVQLSPMAAADLLSALRQQLIGDTWQTVDAADWRYDERARASILKINGTGPVDWDDEDDGTKSLALPGGGFSPPDKRVRPVDQDQNAPYLNEPEFACHVTTVRVPQSTWPAQWSFNSGFDTRLFGRNYYRVFGFRDGAVRMIRGSRVELLEIDAAAAARDNVRIAAFDNSKAVITYDKAGGGTAARASGSVPATDEIDWTADQVPCTSSGAPVG